MTMMRKQADARSRPVDVVGLGLNAADTILSVRKFPAQGGKERVTSISHQSGGQIATALVACQRLGLRTRYIGKVGDDEGGRFQLQSLRTEGIDVRSVQVVKNASTQFGIIIVDETTGERTVFWDRDSRLAVLPSELDRQTICSARALLVDGCDVAASVRVAQLARRAGIPVVADLDTVYPKLDRLLPLIDYLIASAGLLPALTGHTDPVRALKSIARNYQIKAAGATLGPDGALMLCDREFHYSPGFVVKTVDTTGAGDVFHGTFIFGLLQKWPIDRILDFSNAMAALNCTRLGARAGIATRKQAERLMASGARHRAILGAV